MVTTSRLTLTPANAQCGMTLIEILIAVTLSIGLLAGIIQILNGSKHSNNIEEAILQIQENGRYAVDEISNALYYRGFEGCKRPVVIDPRQESSINWSQGAAFTTIVANDFPIDNIARDALRGHEVSEASIWSPTPDSDLQALRDNGNPKPRPNSDVISISYTTSKNVSLGAQMTSLSDAVVVNDASLTFRQDDIVFLGDCTKTAVFRISNEPGNTAPISLEHKSSHNTSDDLPYRFGPESKLRFSYTDTYYVGDTGRNTEHGDDIYALYRYRDGESEELIDGVEFLQLEYGEELSTGNIRYAHANDATLNMRSVHSVRIGLLLQSTNKSITEDDTRSYQVLSTVIDDEEGITHSGKKYLRKTFSSTIKLRNRS